MAAEFPVDLQSDVKDKVAQLLPMLKEAGWTVDPIRWESTSATSKDRRVSFDAKSDTGKRVHSSCPESRLTERLTVLLTSTA
jgi:hypothetical protein